MTAEPANTVRYEYRVVLALVSALRWLFAATATLALGTFIIWFSFPDVVQRLDDRLRERVLRPHEQQLELAQDHLSAGKEELAVNTLSGLLEALEPNSKQDRVAVVKRKAFELLVPLLIKNEADSAAREVVVDWLEFDPLDLRAQVHQARLSDNPEARLSALYEKYPASTLVQGELARFLSEAKNLSGQFELASGILNQQPDVEWEVQWEGSADKASTQQHILTPMGDGRYSLEVFPPSDATGVRFKPGARTIIGDINLKPGCDSDAAPMDLLKTLRTGPGTSVYSGAFLNLNPAGSFLVDLAELDPGSRVCFTASVYQAPHPILIRFLFSPAGKKYSQPRLSQVPALARITQWTADAPLKGLPQR